MQHWLVLWNNEPGKILDYKMVLGWLGTAVGAGSPAEHKGFLYLLMKHWDDLW